MAEYIKRDEVIAALDEFRLNQTVPKYATVMQCRAARDAISRATKVLESLPAADVEPVRYGRWEKNIRGDYCVVCSECGFGLPTNVFCWMDCNRASDERETTSVMTGSIMDYCPNCGADMREEVDNAQE